MVSEEGLVRGEDYETRVLTGTEGYLIRGCSKGLDSWEVFLHEIEGRKGWRHIRTMLQEYVGLTCKIFAERCYNGGENVPPYTRLDSRLMHLSMLLQPQARPLTPNPAG